MIGSKAVVSCSKYDPSVFTVTFFLFLFCFLISFLSVTDIKVFFLLVDNGDFRLVEGILIAVINVTPLKH